MSIWYKPADRLPKHNQDCLLMDKTGERVVGPILWKAFNSDPKSGAWLDLFATPEAGLMYSPDMVLLWTDWDAIKPPEEQVEAACMEPMPPR